MKIKTIIYPIDIPEDAAIPDKIPNDDTLAAIREGDEMLSNGTGQRFDGTTEDIFRELMEE